MKHADNEQLNAFNADCALIGNYQLFLATILPKESMQLMYDAQEVYVNTLRAKHHIYKPANLRTVMQSAGMLQQKIEPYEPKEIYHG